MELNEFQIFDGGSGLPTQHKHAAKVLHWPGKPEPPSKIWNSFSSIPQPSNLNTHLAS
jgi:hypothetical protein